MPNENQPFHDRILSGSDTSLFAKALRAATAVAEPAYATVMRARNLAYDRGIKTIHRLPLPTISVGNLTTGGTGKTPVVRWLAEHFIRRSLTPAILMRGYRSGQISGSDEQRMLQSYLGENAQVIANPDRRAGAATALQRHPKPDLFLLDDGYQHRKIYRDFNLLLISATSPFGFNHVLPRGLLREPLSAIGRAHAILLTRTNQVTPSEISDVRSQISNLTACPIYLSSHTITSFKLGDQVVPLSDFAPHRPFVFCGIGDPASFFAQFPSAIGTRAFADHHHYGAEELEHMGRHAYDFGASCLVTTEKDFAKIARFIRPDRGLPIYRPQLDLTFHEDSEVRLLAQITAALPHRSAG